jgi:hypothetical protein
MRTRTGPGARGQGGFCGLAVKGSSPDPALPLPATSPWWTKGSGDRLSG